MSNVIYNVFNNQIPLESKIFYLGSITRKLDNGWKVIENDREEYLKATIPIYHHPSISLSSIFRDYDIHWTLVDDVDYIYPLVNVLTTENELEKWLARNKYDEKVSDILNFIVYKVK